MKVTPFLPLTLRGRFKGRALILRGTETPISDIMRAEVRKIAVKRLMRDEKGQALVLTLLLLLIGSLIVTPVLGLMGTGVKSGRVYEQKDNEIYAADAGVEDAMWRIRYDDNNSTLLKDVLGGGYNEYDYSSTYPYQYNLSVNDKDVAVNISNVWIPEGISTPDPVTAREIAEGTPGNPPKLMIIGYPDAAASTYDIKIVYYYQGSSALNVKTIGIWLASGFEYVMGSSDFEKASGQLHSVPNVSLYKGGCAVVWNFVSPYPLLSSFTGGTLGPPLVKTFKFQYTGPEGQIPELVASWIGIDGVVPGTTYSCSWDDSIRLYKIVSKAGDIRIEAYGAKTKFRKIKSAVSGDYFGTGNSFITGMEDPYNNIHYLLRRSASATVATNDNDDTLGIPSDATIDAAYLYWTGWIDWNTYDPPNSGSQTKYPSGDTIGGSTYRSGTWDKTTNMYSYVDEAGAHDGDSTYLLHGTTAGYMLFSFPAFTVNVPTGMAIKSLTVSLVAKDYPSSGTNTMRPAIRVGGSSYYGDYIAVPSSYGTISYTWAENPRTNQPWTQDQINGVGSNALQGFGVSSNDASPQIRLTQVYATVTWGSTLKYPANPTQEDLQVLVENTARVNKVYFKGGSSADTLITTHDWQTLYPDAFEGSSTYGGTWYYTCKADVTDLMKGWIGTGTIASNGAGQYTVGHVAATNQEDPTYSFIFASGGGSTGYPLGTPAPQQSNPPTRYTAAHAGWSLLILYHCASVYNHQFYLYDIDTPGFNFFFGWNGGSSCPLVDPDWDNDGNDGGTVSGFLVPPQIPGETNAARITVFVGEGDKADGTSGNCYCKDRFKVNGTALPDNNIYGLPDVWNGNSRGLPQDAGIDIDQFFVTWSSQILKPMDVSAQINVPTGTDGFTMSYMLLQFRSELGTGGVITNYAIGIG
jgi:hypothetical protein